MKSLVAKYGNAALISSSSSDEEEIPAAKRSKKEAGKESGNVAKERAQKGTETFASEARLVKTSTPDQPIPASAIDLRKKRKKCF